MINALLRSGDIKDFKILGHDGKAAYLVATQIREMFRVKLGKEYADFLAIPQRNDQGNIVDWYIPFDSNQSDGQYDIVPWTSASEAEQSSALILLKEFEQRVVNLGTQLANNPNLEGDQLLFSRLIYDPKHDTTSSDPNLMAIRFPGNDFVYIVDGKPVITFWGFINSQTPQASSPFYCLEPVKKDASIIPPVKMQKPWWKRWWVWLLGLLLLLLLLFALFWLRGCGLKPQLPVDPKPLLDDKSNANLPTVVDEQQNKKDFELKENIDRQNGVINAVKPNVTTSIDTNELPVIVDGKDQSIADVGKNDSNNNQTLDTQPNIDELANNADTNNTGNKDEQTNPVDSDKKENENNVQTLQPLDKNNSPDVNSDTNQSNNLALPEDAMKQGSTKFLDGQWNVGAGIQDEATGKPLQLTYNFNQGNGEVTITRSDGVKCVGRVGSGIENANLNIFSNTEAICSDNTKYQLPKIQCKSSNNNQADCQGIYNNGISFPITMKKQ